MTFSLFSSLADGPANFEHKPSLERRDIRGKPFALFTANVAHFEQQFAPIIERLAGLLITTGDALTIHPQTEHLWYLVVPPYLLPDLHTLASSYLVQIERSRTQAKQLKRTNIELERANKDLARWVDYSELIHDKLRSDLRRYTEWTVDALTEMLKFNAMQLQSGNRADLPQMIASFFANDLFDYTGVAMLFCDAQNDSCWRVLVQSGEWEHRPNLTDEIRFSRDIWQDGNELFVPLIVYDTKYIIIISNHHTRATFSSYEFKFFQLISILLEATYESKTLEEELQRELDERKRTEAALAQALRARDDFLANMSHELRTPLNAILGQTEILQIGIHGAVNDRQHRALKTIEESGSHLLSLINDILDLAKMEATYTELELQLVDVPTVAEAALRLIRDLAHRKNIQVHAIFNPHLPPLRADERRLKQILLNLLSNAVKFTLDGGEIGLIIQCNAEKQVMRFIVWDTGIGIEPEQQERLFLPFVQVDSSLARSYDGTGLGLALVKRIVTLHGGNVRVRSRVGKGSQFIVELPVTPPVTAARQSAPAKIDDVPLVSLPHNVLVSAESPLILIAEDNPLNIEVLTDVLDHEGYRTIVAHNGREAITMAQQYNPNLILMDIQMPIMDGLEAIGHLRNDMALRHTPIIALTGLAMQGDQERCLQAGADDYLSKPIGLNQLKNTLFTHLQSADTSASLQISG